MLGIEKWPKTPRVTLAVLVTAFAPFVVTGIYLYFSRWPERWFTTASDQVAMVVAILVGICGLWLLPLKDWQKAVATLLYVPAMALAIIATALGFVCGMFGDCL